MKEYLLLYKSPYNHYYPIKNNAISGLFNLNEFFFSDYRYYNSIFLNQDQIHGEETIVINDQEHKFLYIFTKDHDPDEHIPDDDLPGLTNEFNSCKISYDNFIKFREKWIQLTKHLPPFIIIYRDHNNWIFCKGFDSKEDMELFVDDNTQTVH